MNETPEHVVRVETEVVATPEQVWAAIATGAGTEAWFVPAEIDEHEGGRIVTRHGPFGDSVGVVTVHEPPHRFAYEEEWSDEPGAPVWATEILVEARDGGTCVVRLVSGFPRGGDGWGDALDGTRAGWARMMTNLRLYLTYFPGRPARTTTVALRPDLSLEQARQRLLGAAGLLDVSVGDDVGGPVAGTVEEAGGEGVLVRTDRGLVEVGAWEHDGVVVTVQSRRYDDGPAGAERDGWTAWLAELFPGARAPVPVSSPAP